MYPNPRDVAIHPGRARTRWIVGLLVAHLVGSGPVGAQLLGCGWETVRCARCDVSEELGATAGAVALLEPPPVRRVADSVEIEAASLLSDRWSSGDMPADSILDPGRRTLGRLPVNMLRGVGGLFSDESLTPLVVGSLSTGIAYQMDDTIRDHLAAEDDDLSDFAADYLGPAVLGVVTVGLMIGARTSDSARFRPMTYDLVTATVSNLLVTGAMKAAVSRERPNGDDEYSFPSGHTSNAFTLASVASAHYGNKVGIPAYAVASLIGISRLRSNAHWFSDVVAGAALGHLVGRAVVRQNDKPRKSGTTGGRTVSVFPFVGPSSRGVLVRATFQ